jgi:hypothetical protein
MTQEERLTVLFGRLKKLPGAATPDAALGQVCETLVAVENEFSGIAAKARPGLRADGRMYPPRPDHIEPDGRGGLLANTRRHQILCGADGSIVIRHRVSGKILFSKDGAVSRH